MIIHENYEDFLPSKSYSAFSVREQVRGSKSDEVFVKKVEGCWKGKRDISSGKIESAVVISGDWANGAS